jgi:hypothetical protein
MSHLRRNYSDIWLILMFSASVLVLLPDDAFGQNNYNQSTRERCSPIINGQNNTVICPPTPDNPNNLPPRANPSPNSVPAGPGGRMRFGEFIPTCPFGYGYSLEHRQCIRSQYIGGIIPCSADDTTFMNGRYVPNCR